MGQVALFSVIKWTCFQLTKTDSRHCILSLMTGIMFLGVL